jgi:hypothetical protein
MNTTYICPFCNRDVKVTAPPSKAVDRWEELKAKVDNEMSRVKHAGMVITYNKVLHIMEKLEKS